MKKIINLMENNAKSDQDEFKQQHQRGQLQPQPQQEEQPIVNEEIASPSFIKSITNPNWFVLFLLVIHIGLLLLDYYCYKTSVDIYLVFFVWFPIGNTLSKATGVMQYSLCALFNYFILHLFFIHFTRYSINSFRVTYFAVFETLLYLFANKEGYTHIWFLRIPNKRYALIIFFLAWSFNNFGLEWFFIPIYAIIFQKKIVDSLKVSQETKDYLSQRVSEVFQHSIQGLKKIIERNDLEKALNPTDDVNKVNEVNVAILPYASDKTIKDEKEDINIISNEQIQSHLNIYK